MSTSWSLVTIQTFVVDGKMVQEKTRFRHGDVKRLSLVLFSIDLATKQY